jgi:hypothetical protein
MILSNPIETDPKRILRIACLSILKHLENPQADLMTQAKQMKQVGELAEWAILNGNEVRA